MAIIRATLRWSGFSGAPGYTNLHFLTDDPPVVATIDATLLDVRTAFFDIASRFPNGLSITFPNEVEEFDAGTGVLQGTIGVDLQDAVAGTGGSGPYSSAVGACITWTTGMVVNGRRLRGRTFLVPLAPATAFQDDGTLAEAARVAILGAGNSIINAVGGYPLAIWSRPSPGAGGGAAGTVTSASVADSTAVLRSRRD
jgi:hypothetical protein